MGIAAADIAQHLDYLATVAAQETVHRRYDPAGNVLPVASPRLGSGRRLRGSANPHSKLTEEDVLAMRASAEPNKVWCERLGLSPGVISSARSKRTWRHV